MILGVGNDLIDIDRVKRIIDDTSGQRFLTRILTPIEREMANKRGGKMYEYVAGRFAAKEAIVKALGCGIGEQVSFQDIEITSDSLGKPICSVDIKAKDRLKLSKETRIHISISHTAKLAAAVAVVESI